MSDDMKSPQEVRDTAAIDEKGAVEAGLESAEPQSDIAVLREQLKIKEEEAKINYDRFMRQTAEIENFKKRAIREKEEAIRFANELLIKDLLPALDNLERAVAHAKSCGEGESLVTGVELILKGLFDVLSKHGVVQRSALGQPFDPQLHEAMAQVESAHHEPNTVVEEHHKGYMLRDRLLRPALVTVVKAPKSNEKKNDNGQVENGPTDD